MDCNTIRLIRYTEANISHSSIYKVAKAE